MIFTKQLGAAVVQVGQPHTFTATLDEVADVQVQWTHNNAPSPAGNAGEEGNDRTYAIAAVTLEHAGVWAIAASTAGQAPTTSTAHLVVLEAGVTVERPIVWHKGFVWWAAGGVLGLFLIALLTVAPRITRLWDASVPNETSDAMLLAFLLAITGVALLLVAAFAVLVELRGKAADPSADGEPAEQFGVPADAGPQVSAIIDALGKLGNVQLLAAAGLLSLAGAVVIAWRLVG